MVEEDPLKEHRIAQTIKQDLYRVKTSAQMDAFHRGLEYKSNKTKQVDLDLVNMLINKLEQYAEGWVQANALKTAELWNKSQMLDEQRETTYNALKPELDRVNDLANEIIIKYKSKFSPEILQNLRNLEKAYKDTLEL